MAVAKLTIFFDQPAHTAGWSESYYLTTDALSPGTIEPIAIQLITARMPLSGLNTRCDFFRISVNTGQTRISRLFQTPDNLAFIGNKDNTSDNPTTCLDVQMNNADQSRTKFVFLRGIWDTLVDDGGKFQPNNAAWNRLFAAWINRLQGAQWGWRGKTGDSKKLPIATLVQAANGQILVTTALDLTPLILDKTLQPLRVSRVQSPGNLNGVLTFTVNGPRSFQTVARIPMFDWNNTGFIAYNALGTISIAGGRVARVGERKVGRPFGSVRGRAKNRVRG